MKTIKCKRCGYYEADADGLCLDCRMANIDIYAWILSFAGVLTLIAAVIIAVVYLVTHL